MFSLSDLFDSPLGVFGDEFVGVLGGLSKGGEVVGGAGVAKGDADVAEEAGAFGALDGGFAEEAAEFEVAESEEVAQAVVENGLSGVELGFLRDFCEAVPRADGEAVVAAVDAVAHHGAEFEGDGAFVLDCEVGDAASRIHGVGGSDGLGRAGVDAGGAFAAVVVLGLVDGEGEGGEEVGEEEPGAEAPMDLDGGFSVPAEACFVGEVAFEDGAGVGVVALGSTVLFEEGVEFAETGSDDVVVIAVPRVGCDAVVGGRVWPGVVVEGHHDDGLTAGEDDARVGAALGVALQPSHVAVLAVLDPILVGIGVGGAKSGCDSEVCETEFAGLFGEKGFEFGWVDEGTLT